MRAQDMLLDAARRDPKRIVLCEGDDPRVRAACSTFSRISSSLSSPLVRRSGNAMFSKTVRCG